MTCQQSKVVSTIEDNSRAFNKLVLQLLHVYLVEPASLAQAVLIDHRQTLTLVSGSKFIDTFTTY